MSSARASVSALGAPLTAKQVAALVGGRAEGAEVTVAGILDLAHAGPEEAAFFGTKPGRQAAASRRGSASALDTCRAGLLLVAEGVEVGGRPCVRVENPPLAGARLARHFHPGPPSRSEGVHPGAVVEPGAELGAGTSVGPGCVVRAGARLGERCVLDANVVIQEGVEAGPDCRFHPGVVIYPGVRIGARCTFHAQAVIGADGFGYVWDGESHVKVPQIGTVEIGDDVEVGAGSCIDRATFRATRVGSGTRIDNLVQVGHNCELGRNVVLCACVALAGSTRIGDGSVWGGGALSSGHLTVGPGSTVIGASAVVQDVGAGETVAGTPAWDFRKELRRVTEYRRKSGRPGRKGGPQEGRTGEGQAPA